MSHSVVKKSFTIVLGRISFENFLLRSRGFNDPKKRKKSEIETFVLVIPVLFGMLWKTQTAARDILHSNSTIFPEGRRVECVRCCHGIETVEIIQVSFMNNVRRLRNAL